MVETIGRNRPDSSLAKAGQGFFAKVELIGANQKLPPLLGLGSLANSLVEIFGVAPLAFIAAAREKSPVLGSEIPNLSTITLVDAAYGGNVW